MANDKLRPGDKCPQCGWGKLNDPQSGYVGGFPPTGGDYEFAEYPVTLACESCGASVSTEVRRRYWLDDGTIDYI